MLQIRWFGFRQDWIAYCSTSALMNFLRCLTTGLLHCKSKLSRCALVPTVCSVCMHKISLFQTHVCCWMVNWYEYVVVSHVTMGLNKAQQCYQNNSEVSETALYRQWTKTSWGGKIAVQKETKHLQLQTLMSSLHSDLNQNWGKTQIIQTHSYCLKQFLKLAWRPMCLPACLKSGIHSVAAFILSCYECVLKHGVFIKPLIHRQENFLC